jgi:hypothetical protein
MKKIIILALLTIFSCYAGEDDEPSGGIHIGNGGVVVNCATSIDSRTYKLLDFYEKEVGFKVDYIDPKASPMDIAYSMISRLERLDGHRFRTLKSYLEKFNDSQIFIKRTERLVNLSDTGFSYLAKNCKLEQAAIQREEVVNNQVQFNYVFDQNIWENLSNVDKAGLILHEVIYRDFFNTSSHQSSYYVRKFLRILFSGKINELTLKEYLLQLSLLKVKSYALGDVFINLQKKFVVVNKEVRTAHPIVPLRFKVQDRKFVTYSPMKINFRHNHMTGVSIVPEYGDIKRRIRFNYGSGKNHVDLFVTPHFVSFYPGETRKLYTLQVHSGILRIRGKHYSLVPFKDILYSYKDQIPVEFSVYHRKEKEFYKIIYDGNSYKILEAEGDIYQFLN